MTVCHFCGSNKIESDPASGNSFCSECNTVLEESAIVSEVTFAETASGAAVPLGQIVTASSGNKPRWAGQGFGSHSRESREITIANGRRYLQQVAAAVRLSQYLVEYAQRLFLIAMETNFIQGRKTQHVVAACLYIVCRREKTPHMLIDFSDALQINVFVLGKTYLKFTKVMYIDLPVIDPSVYIHRFASKLEFGDKTHAVAMTAIRLVSRMKRDWMQLGRRPSGLCGAGLLISARLHGFRRAQRDIIHVVKICDMTLRKRLTEFEDTPSSQLTPDEFATIDLEDEADPPAFATGRNKRLKETDEPGTSLNIHLNPPPMLVFPEDDEIPDDFDDEEVRNSILSDNESRIKSELWTEMNKDYLKEQEEKRRLEEESGKEIKKRVKRKRDGKLQPVADTAEEATKAMLAQKKASKKINYDKLTEGLL